MLPGGRLTPPTRDLGHGIPVASWPADYLVAQGHCLLEEGQPGRWALRLLRPNPTPGSEYSGWVWACVCACVDWVPLRTHKHSGGT